LKCSKPQNGEPDFFNLINPVGNSELMFAPIGQVDYHRMET